MLLEVWGHTGCLDLGEAAFIISALSPQCLSLTRSPASAFKWPYRSYTANCPSFVPTSVMLWLATWVTAIPQQMAGMVRASGLTKVDGVVWNEWGDVGILGEVELRLSSPCPQPPTAISAGSDELQTPRAGAAGVGAPEAPEPLWGSLPRAAADPGCTSYCQLPFAAFTGCYHYSWASELRTWLGLFLYSVVSVSSCSLGLILVCACLCITDRGLAIP